MTRDLLILGLIGGLALLVYAVLLAPLLTGVAMVVALAVTWLAIAASQLGLYRPGSLPSASAVLVALSWPAVLFRLWRHARRRRFHEAAVLTAFPRLRTSPAFAPFAGPPG